MIWVIIGPLWPNIGEAYKLSATPERISHRSSALGGSFFRPILGWSTERFGGRRTGLIGLGVTLIPLLLAWQVADSFSGFLAVGLLLGIAGASFAAALPLASSGIRLHRKGWLWGSPALGTAVPCSRRCLLHASPGHPGWRSVFGLILIPVAMVWIVFFLMAKNAPGQRKVKQWSTMPLF